MHHCNSRISARFEPPRVASGALARRQNSYLASHGFVVVAPNTNLYIVCPGDACTYKTV